MANNISHDNRRVLVQHGSKVSDMGGKRGSKQTTWHVQQPGRVNKIVLPELQSAQERSQRRPPRSKFEMLKGWTSRFGQMFKPMEQVAQDGQEEERWLLLAGNPQERKVKNQLGEFNKEEQKEKPLSQKLQEDNWEVDELSDGGQEIDEVLVCDVEDGIGHTVLAARAGDVQAQKVLGTMYLAGQGVKADPVEAARWFRMAAEQGDAVSQCNLGWMHAGGRGVEKNEQEAVRLYRLAAEQGNEFAQYNLALMHEAGRGVQQDDQESVRWCRLAVEKGHVKAQCHLAWMHLLGRGIEKDQQEAIRLYRLAAEANDELAPYNLGLIYEEGIGVVKDKTQAIRWYTLAIERGCEDAAKALRNLYDKRGSLE